MFRNFFFVLLGLAFIGDLYLIFIGNQENRLFTKSLLMPLLFFGYFLESKKQNFKINKIFGLGLVLSFSGDFFLLYNWGFLVGLGSFLLAHICYTVVFWNLKISNFGNKFLLPILVYLVAFIWYLYPHLGEMKIPVILYAITISTMLYSALNTHCKLLIFGALFFVISDSIFAYNLFIEKSLATNLLVMITYVFAQVLLVAGMINFGIKNKKIA